MAKQILNIGAAPNDGNGDPLRDAMDKVNDNFNELYTALGGNTVSNIVSNGLIDYTGANKLTFLFTDISDLPAASSYHGMFAHAHNQGAAYFAHAGSWIELANKSELSNITIGSLIDVDTTSSAPTDGQVLKWNNAGSKWVPADDSNDGSVALTDLSVTVASAGTANLAYNANTGAFTYTPPDLSGYQLISNAFDGDYNSLTNKPTIPSALTDLGISDGTTGQVLKTDGAGNFTFGTITTGSSYGDSDVNTHLNTSTATAGQILSWTGTDYDWVADQTSASGSATVVAPFAFVGLTTTSNGSGVGMSWSNWDGINGTMDFAFDSAQPDTNYIVVTDGESNDDGRLVSIQNKTVNGFEASFYDTNGIRTPSTADAFTIMVYGSTPTQTVVGSGSLTDLSVTTNAAGTAALTYNNGVFTYTPPDLSSYSTFSGAYADLTGKPTIPSSVDDLTDVDITSAAPTDGQALVWDNANSKFIPGTVAAGSSTDTLSDVTARGAITNDAVTINNTLTVTSLDSTGLGFATLQSASDISLNAVGDINANSSKITNVVDPVDLQDAATKNYVDTAISNSEPSFTVTAPDSGRYSYTGSGFIAATDNPALYLYRGFTYHFIINSPGHPFWINSVNGTGQGNAYNNGVTNNGTASGTIAFMVPMDAPATLYYNCEYHGAMNGTINIV